jgi:hypothetical protein
MNCDDCPNRHDCVTDCDFAEEDYEDPDDYLQGDHIIDPETGSH